MHPGTVCATNHRIAVTSSEVVKQQSEEGMLAGFCCLSIPSFRILAAQLHCSV